MRLITATEVIVVAVKANLASGLITEGEAIAEIRDVKGCSEYGARVLLGIEFDPPLYGTVGC